MVAKRAVFVFAIAWMAGCAAPSSTAPATRPVEFGWDGKANLTLDQLQPVPHLNTPATQPEKRAPIEALMLYSQAREATIRQQHKAAIDLLEQAAALDPHRFDLQYDLGWAYAGQGDVKQAIAAFEKAVNLNPDSLEAQTQLGRLYLDQSDSSSAMAHLRLAIQTPDYASNDSQAAVVDFYLGRALKNLGYDRAALDQFMQVMTRLQKPNASLRQNPAFVAALGRPEILLEQIGELLEKHGDYADALQAFKPSVDRQPDNLPLQSRYAHDLALNGQRDDALNKAVDLVVRQRASVGSLNVLREVCRLLNISDGVTSELRKLHARRPGDRAVLFALADTHLSKKRTTEAWDLLQSAWLRTPADVAITRRLFTLEKQLNQVEAAAQLLIHATTCNPDAMENYIPLWIELLGYNQPNRLKVVSLQLMKVSPDDEAARQVWIAVTADYESRYVLQRTSLESACRHTPPFAPAFRMLLDVEWKRPDLNNAEKLKTTEQLVEAATGSGDSALAAELRGRANAYLRNFTGAAGFFSEAERLGGRSPDLLLSAAQAARDLNQGADYPAMLRKIIADHPMHAGAYESLHEYLKTTDADAARKVLSSWRDADPQSDAAKLLQAVDDAASGRVHEAERDFDSAFADDPDYPTLIASMVDFYRQCGRADDLLTKLEAARIARPRDTDLVARIAVLYSQQNRRAEAVRLLDDTRALVSDEADALYSLVDTYLGLDQNQTARDVLQQVIQIDPTHAGACNGLGFEWADEGRNLPQAEALIRIALAQEPDNVRFLDSLGWVLFKQGKMIEARDTLQSAIAPMASPNPMVLNHLGDVLDKMQKHDEAIAVWQQSLKALSDDHLDQKKVRLRLIQKIKSKS